MTKKSFYVSMLRQFANTGNELLDVCDRIISGDIRYFDQATTVADYGRSDEIDF